MAWRVEFAAAAERDLGLIFAHLRSSYQALGDPLPEAQGRAAARVGDILATAERIATAPHRGTAHDDLLPGLRHLTIGRAVYWFIPDHSAGIVRILAVFLSGQNDRRRMLLRLLRPPDDGTEYDRDDDSL